jgi:WhiB family redox-sensing transcriptional regulator
MNEEWREEANCKDVDPDIFFSNTNVRIRQSDRLQHEDLAKRICSACDVSRDCLEYAIITNQESGIWGGTAEDERRIMRKYYLANRRARS